MPTLVYLTKYKKLNYYTHRYVGWLIHNHCLPLHQIYYKITCFVYLNNTKLEIDVPMSQANQFGDSLMMKDQKN